MQPPKEVLPFPGSYTTLPVDIAKQLFRDADVPQTSDQQRKDDVVYNPVNFYVMAPRDHNPNNGMPSFSEKQLNANNSWKLLHSAS